MKTDMAKVIYAVTKNMDCLDCPYPCKSRFYSSLANCQSHWYEILDGIEMSSPEETGQRLFEIYVEHHSK